MESPWDEETKVKKAKVAVGGGGEAREEVSCCVTELANERGKIKAG